VRTVQFRRGPQLRLFERPLHAGVLALACASVLAGCGGSAPRADPTQEARVISEANAFCQHVSTLPPVTRRSQQQIRSIQARFAALTRAISDTAAYLPAGKDLNEAHAARRALMTEARQHSHNGLSPSDFNTRVNRLQLRIFNDELALGLTCDGQIAARAHETARAIARSPN
jgi:hypothetical protein